MKQVFFLSALLVLCVLTFGQQVPRNKVIVEIGTGTWCQYCPGAAMGADDLIANGCEVAVVENHNGDDYANVYSNARNSYYGITGYPTAFFDGVLSVVGGNHTQSMYPSYLPKYNVRHAIQSSFTIEVEGTHTGFSQFNATVTVNKVSTSTSTNMALHFVVTESHIEEFWQGMDELNFVNRIMVPNQSGTSVNFSGGNTQVVNLSFTRQPAWVAENCEVVVFLQDLSTKEILQGMKMDLLDFTSANSYDGSVKEITGVPETNCAGSVAPVATIANYGNQPLTSLDINFKVNNGSVETFNWTGNLTYLGTEDVQLPEINFTVNTSNSLDIYCSNPNGQPDQYPGNDNKSMTFGSAPVLLAPAILFLRTDENPGETTWELLDNQGTVLYSGGPYNDPLTFYKDTFYFNTQDCHKLVIHDAGGNGLCCDHGMGIYFVKNFNNVTVIEGGEFGYSDEKQFETDIFTGDITFMTGQDLVINPNPFTDQFSVYMNNENAGQVIIRIFDMTGKEVYMQSGDALPGTGKQMVISNTGLEPGIYYIQVDTGEKVYTRKILKTE